MHNKRNYIKPRVKAVDFIVENGFVGSNSLTPIEDQHTIFLGSNEEVGFNGGIHFGNGAASDNGSNVEGIGDGGHVYF